MTMMNATTRAQRFDSLEQEAFLNLWRTYDRLRQYEDALFAEFDLTPQQYNVLRILTAAHPTALATLVVAERLVSRAPDITRMIDKLESRKLIRRERSTNDRRSVFVAITDTGLALVEEIAEPLRVCHEKQLGHLSRVDLKKLVSLLRESRGPHEEGSWQT